MVIFFLYFKISFGKIATTLGYFFPLFQYYWTYCRDFENERLTHGQFLILHSTVHEKLLQQWREFKWNEAELEWIVSRILIKNTILDTSEFITHPTNFSK